MSAVWYHTRRLNLEVYFYPFLLTQDFAVTTKFILIIENSTPDKNGGGNEF